VVPPGKLLLGVIVRILFAASNCGGLKYCRRFAELL
jgi:hypothetical protein